MTQIDLKKILSELYEIDPELKKHESELTGVIEQFLQARPDVSMDSGFRAQLRQELMKKAEELKPLPPEDERGFSWAKFFTVRTLSLVTAGASVAVIVMLIVFNLSESDPGKTTDGGRSTASLSEGQTIKELSSRAFGDLTTGALVQTEQQGIGFGGGGAPEASLSGPQTESAHAVMRAPVGYTNTVYDYDGPLPVIEEYLNVLKRVTDSALPASTQDMLDTFDLGTADLTTFSDTTIQNITFSQDSEFGYSIDVNLANGTINIREVWEQWYGDTNNPTPLSESDIPSDKELIQLADAFLDDHRINQDAYGAPRVQAPWRQQTETWFSGPEAYIPETVQVLYPLTIDGKKVYLQSGEPAGMYVNISNRYHRVTGVVNLSTQHYQSAPYTTVQDESMLREKIARGGLFGWAYSGYSPDADNTDTTDLSEPELHYVLMAQTESGVHTEYLVPALVFPIESGTQGRENVIVPVIQDFFDATEERQPGSLPIPTEPLPLLDEPASDE